MRRVALSLGCGLLALASAWAEDNAPGSKDRDPSHPRGVPLPSLKLDELTATRDRPLFAPDRRPQPPAKPPQAVATQKPQRSPRPELMLKGIISEGTETFVLLEDMSLSETLLVRAGDTIGAWRILVDTDHSVILAGQDERFKLQMFEEDGAGSK